MVDFAGWSLPVQYPGGTIAEHNAVRGSAGLFDVSHMGECEVSGPDAAALLDLALTNEFSSLETGRARYSPMCGEDGGCLDDLIAYRTGEASFLLVLNASNAEADEANLRRLAAAEGLDCGIRDRSGELSMIALQGPDSPRVLEAALGSGMSALEKFSFREAGELFISRTGYTGSDGFEIAMPNALAEGVAESLAAAGAVPCGLGARDSLRLEACYPLHGHEIGPGITPLQAGLGWAVKFSKQRFSGREALLRQREAGCASRVAFFAAEGRRMPREGSALADAAGEEAGRVLSGAWSPALDAPIGSCLVKTEFLQKELFAKVRDSLIKVEFKKNFI